MIKYPCSACGAEIRSPSLLAGQMDICPKCGSSNAVPPQTPPAGPQPPSAPSPMAETPPAAPPQPPAEADASERLLVICPYCKTRLNLEPTTAARALCASCNQPFRIQDAGATRYRPGDDEP